MAHRNVLHKNKLEALKAYLDAELIAYRDGKGAYQVLQVHINNNWQVIYSRLDMPEHYTIPNRLLPTVRAFINKTRK